MALLEQSHIIQEGNDPVQIQIHVAYQRPLPAKGSCDGGGTLLSARGYSDTLGAAGGGEISRKSTTHLSVPSCGQILMR